MYRNHKQKSNMLSVPDRLEVMEKLTLLNEAYARFYTAQTRSERNEADRTFNDCFDWFVLYRIRIYQDPQTQVWLLSLTAEKFVSKPDTLRSLLQPFKLQLPG